MLTNFSVRTTLPRRILSLTNICVRIITYDFFLYELFLYELLSRRTFIITNILHTYFIPYEHLYTNFNLRIFVRQTLSLTNICIRTFSIRTFSIRTSVLTNFCRYEYFTYVLYTIGTFAYEQLRTNFMHTNYFHTYFGPTTRLAG